MLNAGSSLVQGRSVLSGHCNYSEYQALGETRFLKALSAYYGRETTRVLRSRSRFARSRSNRAMESNIQCIPPHPVSMVTV